MMPAGSAERGAAWRLRLVAVAFVALVAESVVAADIRTPQDLWQGQDGKCLSLVGNPGKAENIRRLALVLLGQHDEKIGCTTFPYLGSPYDIAGNVAHAGIDFRANGVAVRAAEAGTVVSRAFDPANARSTLIIENNGRSRKTVYLHMSTIDVAQGSYVFAGQKVGTAGSVGADHAHLHFEVWPAYSPLYCSRDRAISGTACPEEGGVCGAGRVETYTMAPETVIQYPDNTARPRRSSPSVSYSDRVTFDGVGRLKVGLTPWEALKGLDELVLGDDGAECAMVTLQSAECGLSVMLRSGRIARVDVDQGSYRTAEGIGIGSSEADLRRVYGAKLKSEPNHYIESGQDLRIEASVNGQRRAILFVVVNGKVESFRAGDANPVGWIEHCL
jgi:hypothetical protein